MITNETLLGWLDAYMEPDKWIIEITGGEPGLYPEINKLVEELNNRGYAGMVKTNGSLPIHKTENIKLISAWHKGRAFPLYYDEIVILKNPEDDWKAKEQYCKENGISYHTVLFDTANMRNGKRVDMLLCEHHKIIYTCHINSSGQITKCAKDPVNPAYTIFNMTPPQTMNVLYSCPKCKGMYDVEMFLGEDIKTKIKADFEELKRNLGGNNVG
jgi:hypothetical protein